MIISNIEQAEALLQKYVPNVSKYSGDSMSLDRLWPLLKLVGSPEKKLKVIHIAGTSGKTSTSYYISALLSASGKKVGLTVSPHVDKITERLQINNRPIDEVTFCTELGIFMSLIADVENPPSYFELLIVFVLWEFDRQKVDYAVIETGMGGLLDGTNVITRGDKVCVITDIGFDHMHILGNTLPEISRQKAGVIQHLNSVFVYEQAQEIMDEINKRTQIKDATLNILDQADLMAKSLTNLEGLPVFQIRNWLLSEKVCYFVAKRENFKISKITPTDVLIPGRMETIKLDDSTTLIMDGAHNEQKIGVFCRSFKARYPNKKATILLALKDGKEYKEVIDALKPISDALILTTFNTSQDLPAVSQDTSTLAEYCDSKGINNSTKNENKEAFSKLLDSESQIKLVIGSFYLLGQVRKFL